MSYRRHRYFCRPSSRTNAPSVSWAGEASSTEKTIRRNRRDHGPPLPTWLANASATIAGSLRNTPQPQAPRTSTRHPCAAAKARTCSERRTNVSRSKGSSSGVLLAMAPGVRRCACNERRRNGPLQKISVVIPENRATRRDDHRVRVQAGSGGPVTLVIVRGPEQRGVQRRTAGQRLFLGLAAVEKAAARVLAEAKLSAATGSLVSASGRKMPASVDSLRTSMVASSPLGTLAKTDRRVASNCSGR